MARPFKRGRRRALARFVGVWVVLAFILLLTSVKLPPAGHAAFPGTNGKIAFQSHRDGNAEIYVMNADGGGQTRLTNNPAGDSTPAWSADGTKLAFVSDRDGNAEIYVMNADGSGQTRLTNNSAGDVNPAWSPDGMMIAFGRDEAFGIRQIWVIDANGSGETQLTNDSLINSAPVWSPDGTKIAFFKAVFGGDAEVFVMNTDGSGQTNLSNNQAHPDQDLDPDWSPDGTKLAFFRGGGGLSEIWVMNADGSGQTKLSTSSTVGDGVPVWSPDGAKIAFTSLRDGNPEIYVMDAGGSVATRLTNNPAFDHFPDWQPIADSDNDGVLDDGDVCPASVDDNISLNPNQYAQNSNFGPFEVGPKNDQSIVYDMTITNGCTCKQIVEQLGVGQGHIKKGCSPSVMEEFTGISAEPDREAGIGKK